jgi:GTP pyrophosphokinase
LDLFYRVGVGSIDNQAIEDYAKKALINFFKSKIKRSGPTADADVHKQVLSSNYDMLVFGKNKIN